MHKSSEIRIDLNQVLIALFCLYAFSMPYELILEILFGIETIFKPFRLISIAIIGVFALQVLRQGLYFNREYLTDSFLYFVFIYGLLISSIRIMQDVFNFGLFYNDLFQSGLHLATFFVYKNTQITKIQARRIFHSFVWGLAINSFYTFYVFFFEGYFGRQGGFTDNPNYAALGLVAASAFLFLEMDFLKKNRNKIIYILLLLFLTYIFVITGSRTGLIMLVVSIFFVFMFSPLRKKLTLLALSGGIILLLLPQQLDNISLGGPLILIRRVSKDLNSGEEDVRFVIWRGIFRVLEDQGYMGLGIGQFKAKFPRYYGEESNKLILEIVNRGYYLSPHNDYLAILADYGILSLFFYAIFLYFSMRKVIQRMVYPTEDEVEILLHRFSFIMLSCLIIFGLAAENFQHQLFWFLLMFSTKSYE